MLLNRANESSKAARRIARVSRKHHESGTHYRKRRDFRDKFNANGFATGKRRSGALARVAFENIGVARMSR